MSTAEQLQKMKTQPGFVAALDQSGGSTPLGQDAVPSRYPPRVQPGVALRMAANHDRWMIHGDVGPA